MKRSQARDGGPCRRSPPARGAWIETLSRELECKDIEAIPAIPGKMASRSVVKGTRIEPETIVQDFDLGAPVEEIHENFPTVPVSIIRSLIVFERKHQPVP